ncbi:histidine kinase [Mucilaginibacter sp. JRF]|uniref:sensor histidine kinase n=1 Tax=Mucilaginibacter sp. JRF TaxID=2780088 RepID=UPI00188302CD|nr:histidine kinase [Mucilaginibacter sp. JRF]MBE9583240.1 histidine kinase [Mucilaginibacter sp. JRF]
MVKLVIKFFKANGSRLLLLTMFSLFIYSLFFTLSYVVNPEQTAKNFAGRAGFPLNILTFLLESVITHYILIFEVILPAMHKQRSYQRVVIIALLLFAIKFTLNYSNYLYEYRNGNDNSADGVLSNDSLGWVLIISYLFTLISSFSVALLFEWVHKDKQRIMLEKQKTEAELSALKHQINPHFLFNSLSFIYGKVFKLDKETADSVLILANIMRYALGKSPDGKVNIMDELEHMKNVMEINQRRHNNGLNISYHEQIDDQSISILPLILITLVENAFKHGDLHDPAHPLVIRVDTSVNELSFDIRNKKGKGIKELSNGIGLQNIRQQLKLTYGKQSSFLVEENDICFNVSLKITFAV